MSLVDLDRNSKPVEPHHDSKVLLRHLPDTDYFEVSFRDGGIVPRPTQTIRSCMRASWSETLSDGLKGCQENDKVRYGAVSVLRRKSPDHSVGLEKNRWRNGKVKLLCGFEIDYEFKATWSLHRQVSRLATFQDLVHIRCRVAK